MLEPIGHHELLVFWVQLLLLFAAARLLGGAARRVGLPAVVGELSAGLVLGPSILGVVWEGGFDWFLPGGATSSALLQSVTWFSAAFLLVVAGFETDLALIRRLGRATALVTVGSVALPFAGGVLVGWALPVAFHGPDTDRTVFALFIALSVAVSALAVVAKILAELGLMRRDVGQITLAAGTANDLVGWLVLGVISGLAASGRVSLVDAVASVLGLAAFLALALTLGQRVIDGALRSVRRGGTGSAGALTVAILAMFAFGAATQALGVEAVLGAFVAGVVLARSRYRQADPEAVLELLTTVLFAPLFFATAGLRVDLTVLRGDALLWALLVLGLAVVLKGLGSYVGGRLAGLGHREGLVVGAGLNARGTLEIIIATVGLSLGVLNDLSFTMIAVIPLVSSLLASVGMRTLATAMPGSPLERARLAREEALARNVVVREGRLLVPTQGGPNSIVAAQILHLGWPEDLPATLVTPDGDDVAERLAPLHEVFHGRAVDVVRARGPLAVEQVAAQSRLGYAVIGVGAPDEPRAGSFVSPLVDGLLSQVEIPVVIVRRARDLPGPLPGVFARALVPVVGSRSSRAAEELAGNLSARLGTEIVLSNVVYRSPVEPGRGPLARRRPRTIAEEVQGAERVLAAASAHMDSAGANHRTEVRFSAAPADEILVQAEDVEADLIVLGARLRRLAGHPFLGQNVEHLLLHARQTVVVVVVPEDVAG